MVFLNKYSFNCMKAFRTILPISGLLAVLLLLAATPFSPKPKQVSVAFYNVENLFDTEDDPLTNDDEFMPEGSYHWTKENYETKLANLSKVISKLGDEDGPEILGVCEVENKAVLEDLIKEPLLKKKGYGIVHHESPDGRGIDVALLYKKKVFMPLYQRAYTVNLADSNPDIKTRDILLVKGILNKKHEVTLVVNHWSSRRGGEEKSNWKRVEAAKTLRHVLDSIQTIDKNTNLILMGDFNDGPANESIKDVLRAGRDKAEAGSTGLFNPMYKLKQEGLGSLKYRQWWNMFDQVIVSAPMLMETSQLRYVDCSATIYNPKWMRVTKEGDWIDAPKRSHIRREFYPDGYSDHFPVYIHLEHD